jgi:NADH-quinone oxidoreductase subunit D
MNVRTNAEVERIVKARQEKIYRELLDQDTSVLFDDPLENDMVLNMGPQHPATHGVLRVLLRLDGENIIKCVPEVGYLHRGYEKLAENVTYHEFMPHTDRLDYLSPMSNNVAIAQAIEKSLDLEIPDRAKWIRVLVAEMARVSSHLMAMGSTCMDVGALTVLLWTFIEREKLYDIFELICGARFTTSFTRIGGVANDIPDDAWEKLKVWVDEFPAELKKMGNLVHRNKIFVDRVSGIGIFEQEDAIKYGMTGPILRATGIPYDIRRDEPYLIYDQLDFDVIYNNEADAWGRYMIRVQEMSESIKIIRQVMEKMPKGDIIAQEPTKALPRKANVYTKMEELINDFMLINFGAAPEPGETYSAIEAPKGELGFFIVSDGTGHPWKMYIRTPSTYNLQALKPMVEGSMLSDVVAVIGSIDPVMGEADK